MAALAALLAAGCATAPGPPAAPATPATAPAGAGAAAAAPASLKPSAECEAARLRQVDALPASAIPEAVLRQARSGHVSVRYDVVAGKARNAVVVASEPPGLYDAAVLRHVAAYGEPTGATVRGCLSTTTIRF